MAKDVKLYEGVIINGSGDCLLEEGAVLYMGTIITLGDGGRFQIGKNSHIGAYGYILVGDGMVEIGAGTAVGPHTLLIAHTNAFDGNRPIIEVEKNGIVKVGDDVFIGAGVIVLPDITISAHSVIGAGSVVTQNVDEWNISVGIPAHVIGLRNGENKDEMAP